MSSGAFPDAKQHFRNAFAQPYPPPELLGLIKEHPTYPAVSDLLTNYIFVAEENPERADTLASALVAVRDAPDAPKIGTLSLSEIFSQELAYSHGCDLDMTDDTQDFGPQNAFLITSLLSGLSFKYRLTSSSDQYANIMAGLNANVDSPASEVLVTGACIQLLVGGLQIVSLHNSYIQSAQEVETKLKGQKSAGTVKHENALKLLEFAISHAETGFQRENDIGNVWQLLFPSQG